MLVSFRPCGPKDHAVLLKLVAEYYRYDKIPFKRESLSKGVDALLRNVSQGKVWLIENHRKPVGYAILTYSFDLEYGGVEGMLTDLYVIKKFRNRGIGSMALYEIEDYCRERGIRQIEVQIQNHNRDAEKFYREAGFQPLKRKVLLMPVHPEISRRPSGATAGKRR